ncbi:MAG: histone deacetylase [Myxococcales bacterium]|nr:histone deacetylase [Myxococcales bacterium]
MNVLALVDDPLFSEHEAPAGHPERPERLDAARAGVARAHLGLATTSLDPRDASDEELGRVHGHRYLDRLGQAAGNQGYFDADTFYGPRSVMAARRAAGGAIALVDALSAGHARYGLGLVRPPGHHARPDGAMGFCLLNNVAVAAAHARARGVDRVVVLDWDVHHGNGTQEMFYAEPGVLYISLHQYPFYPGTGAVDEVGRGEGAGFTVNVPLSAGAGDATYLAAFERVIEPVISEYDPGLVLISAGFDAHRSDPLASMKLSSDAYGLMLARVARAMPRGAAGRLGLVLEGGYDLRALSDSLTSTLMALEDGHLGEPAPATSAGISPRHEQELDRIVAQQGAFWHLA